ncbi:hypothetical protein [Paenibacillus polymyxa]|uniref:DUF2213 domain-containing protein n=1 Tax=Paenibacillus polymyxa TaxID=1406 RepID=A0ABX2ZCQ1_PAEPO|nr:hypothetical protein [Paenibacillus polymyxa]ODA09235.1 hypothetical protein A7312_26630 [Paenibacillus polymyxa]
MAKPTPEQLAKINQLARVPLTEDEAYVFPAKLVGDQIIPRRFYRLTPNFLRKMAVQAREGVSLLLDHSWANMGVMTIPLGRTFDSRLQMDGDELALYADHYMKLGQEVGDIKIDQIAEGIDAGTIFDTSIGFTVTSQTCSICGQEYFGGNCPHIRGREYDSKLCTVDINDGDLMENSLVFDGAYPGAGVVGMSNTSELQSAIKCEALSEDAKSLPSGGRVFYSFSGKSGLDGFVLQQDTNNEAETQAKGDDTVTDEQKAALAGAQTQATALAAANNVLGQIRAALSVENDTDILSKLTSLSAQAADGVTYKVKITEQACGAGVRALGEAFNVEAMKTALSHLPVSEIEKIGATYETQAQAALGGGGRHTQGDDVNLPEGALNGTPPTNSQNDGGEKTPEQLKALAREEARAALKNTGRGNLLKEDK